MRSDKDQAIKMRLAGKTYTEIASALAIPKSTLSGWLGKILISERAQDRIRKKYKAGSYKGLAKKAKEQTANALLRAKNIKENASRTIGKIGKQELFYIGLGLYLGEGYKKLITKNGINKTYHPVSLTNSDPLIVRLFIRFLKELCAVEDKKIKLSIHLYRDTDEMAAQKF